MNLSRLTDQSLKPVPLSTDRSDFLTQINMITAPNFSGAGLLRIRGLSDQ
jgi:hypothetical protein